MQSTANYCKAEQHIRNQYSSVNKTICKSQKKKDDSDTKQFQQIHSVKKNKKKIVVRREVSSILKSVQLEMLKW